jgi:hypothetical protein
MGDGAISLYSRSVYDESHVDRQDNYIAVGGHIGGQHVQQQRCAATDDDVP